MVPGFSNLSYSGYLLQKLQQQREEGSHCDFNLHVEDQIFKVHKCILAANSVMMKSFLSSLSANADQSIVLAYISAKAVKTVLNYMYTGNLYFTDEQATAEEIWDAAKILNVPEVENMCKVHIESVNKMKGVEQQGQFVQTVRVIGLSTSNSAHQQDNGMMGTGMVNQCQTGSVNANSVISQKKSNPSENNTMLETTKCKSSVTGENLNVSHQQGRAKRSVLRDSLSSQSASSETSKLSHPQDRSLRSVLKNSLLSQYASTETSELSHQRSSSMRSVLKDNLLSQSTPAKTSKLSHQLGSSKRSVLKENLLSQSASTETNELSHQRSSSIRSVLKDNLLSQSALTETNEHSHQRSSSIRSVLKDNILSQPASTETSDDISLSFRTDNHYNDKFSQIHQTESTCSKMTVEKKSVYGPETKPIEHHSAEIQPTSAKEMKAREDQPVIWETLKRGGELFLYKVEESGGQSLLRTPKKENPIEGEAGDEMSGVVSVKVETEEGHESERAHDEHPYSLYVHSDSESHHVSKSQADSVSVSDTETTISSAANQRSAQANRKKVSYSYKPICAICKSNLNTKTLLIEHLQTAHERFCAPVKCLYCPRLFLHKQLLINHMVSAHTKCVNERGRSTRFRNRVATCKKLVNDLIADFVRRDSKISGANRHTCRFCKKMFRSKKTLYQHVKNKHQQLRFKCLTCRWPFPSQESLRLHQQNVHQSKVNCSVCAEKFKSELQALRHTAEKHPEYPKAVFTCKFCSRNFSLKSLLENHKCSDESNLKCRKCFTKCHTYGHFMRHARDNEWRSFTCEICRRTFDRQCALKKHKYSYQGMATFSSQCTSGTLKEHDSDHGFNNQCTVKTGENSQKHVALFHCPICKENVLRVNKTLHLHDHKVASTDSDGEIAYRFECQECKKQFKCLRNYLLHLKNHEMRHQNKCDVCGDSFHNPKFLQRHKSMHRDTSINCENCGQLFPHEIYYIKHRNHNMCRKPQACPYCGEVFHTWGSFVWHARTHKVTAVHPRLGSGKYYKCPICEQLIKEFCYLQAHIQVHKTGEKPFKCKHCKKAFMKKCWLKCHLAHAHKEPTAKVHECRVCSKKFPCLNNLKIHLEGHTSKTEITHPDSQPNFICDICGKIFSFRMNLVKHLNGHNGNERGRKILGGKSKFEGTCDSCGKLFYSKLGLARHVRKCGGKEFRGECNVCSAVLCTKEELTEHLNEHFQKKEVFEESLQCQWSDFA